MVARLYKGLTGLVKARGITVIEGAGRLTGPTRGHRRRDGVHRASTSCSPPAPTPRTLPGLEIDGDADHRPPTQALRPGPRAGLGDRARRRRDRLRVRQRVAQLRRRRDHRRGAAPPGRRSRTRPPPRRSSARSASAGSPCAPARRFAERQGHRRRRHGRPSRAARSLEAELLLVAVGRGPVTEGLGYEEQGVAMDRGFVLADEHCRTNVDDRLRRRRHRPRPAAGAPRLRPGHLRGRADRRPRPRPHRRGRDPPRHLLPPRGRLRRAHRGAGRRAVRRRQVETLTYDLAGNGKSQILKTQGFVKLVRRTDGPVVGVHLVGDRVGELIGEAQLIYNWEAHAEDVAPLVHAHPTQNEALGEAHLALAGKPCTPTADPHDPPDQTRAKEISMATEVNLPALGESVTEGTVTRWLKQVGDAGRGRRAAARGLHRQGRHRDPLPRRRHAAGDQGRRGRHRRGRRRAGRRR